ncbi:hypothetical protein CRG98_044510 [Punica granatum]|uniref:Uncharacterized protein n=1 Tax=Punica granatum TaxID=22663 RepID=A0A2I0HTR2_PUNGR|nr:hypothetical protein CRG98_044510 [Punica granatum]
MRHEGGGSTNLRCKKVNSNGLADPARLQEARARWLGERAVQEIKLARVSRSGKVARGTSVVALRTCGAGKHERGGTAKLRCRKVSSHGLADPAWLQEARTRWLGELAICKRHGCGGSANLRCRKVSSHGLADSARLQEARTRWLSEFAMQESKLERVSRPRKVTRGTSEVARKLAVQESRLTRVSKPGIDAKGMGVAARRTCGVGKCKRHGCGGSANLRCRKVSSHGLADSARLQEARTRWLSEFAMQESKLERVSRPRKVTRGTSEVARKLAVQESRLTRVSKPGIDAKGMGVAARRTCGVGKCKRHGCGGSANLRCRKVSSHGLADSARLQEARTRWLSEFAMQESKLERVSRPRKVTRGTSEVARKLAVQESRLTRVSKPGIDAKGMGVAARRTCGVGKCKRHGCGGSANLRCRKVSSHGLADSARLQEARTRWLSEFAMQESKLERVSRPRKVTRGTSEVARKLAVQESRLTRVSKPGIDAKGMGVAARRTCGVGKCKRHGCGGSANLRCRKVSSHGLADSARLQEARTRWLSEFAMQESKLERVSRPRKVTRGTSEVARKLAVQESRLTRVSKPGIDAKGMGVAARRTCGVGKHERVGLANLRCKKWNSLALANLARLERARARWLGELAVQQSKLARVS